MGAERIGDARQRLAEMLAEHLLVGDVVGHFAQPIHIVRESDEASRLIGERVEGVAHHRRAQHFVEGADMRQPRGAVAGFEQHRAAGLTAGIARSEEHTSELQSLMRISYAVFCLKKQKTSYQPSHERKSQPPYYR